jgi:hypothetical protein
MDNSVPCVGYGIFERRRKLKECFKHLDWKQLKALPSAQRDDFVEIPKVSFLCDTTTSVFTSYPELFYYPTIIIECTFYDEQTIELAAQAKHTHWNDLEPIVRNHPSVFFILIHFSMRYATLSIPNLPANALLWSK